MISLPGRGLFRDCEISKFVKVRLKSFLALVSTDSLVCSNDTDKDAAMGPPVLSDGHWPHYRSRAPAAFKYKAAQNDSPNERFSAAWTNCDIALCGADDKQFTESSHISTVSTVHYAALSIMFTQTDKCSLLLLVLPVSG